MNKSESQVTLFSMVVMLTPMRGRVLSNCSRLAVAQSVECLTAEWEVAGSNPGTGPILRVKN